ncbi:MAG: PQQ-binding-like beta-propeller repeat protein [Sulfurospirillaceae bacterium]|nr:PQQ-binding-like beta-propeller repeat protein [Sulfurospirillaceae bacterium]MDD3462387.1 PQQ-binding-like beta-propeller repeat protein [Sulfurospirillaceae bacterium]
MFNLKLLFLAFLALLVLYGCGTKRQYFEPEQIAGKVSFDGSLPSSIVDVARDGATLGNGQIVTKKGLLDIKFPKGFIYFADDSQRYVAGTRCGELMIVNKSGDKVFETKFDSAIASVALKDNLLAVVLGANRLVVVDLKDGNIAMDLKQDPTYALDSRIASPYFLSSLIVFPTLDGKLVIVDKDTKKTIRDVVITSDKFFANVVFLNVLGDRLVAATKSKVVSINPKSMNYLDSDVKDVVVLENRIFIFTKDGRVLLTDSDLKVLKERKFKFANFAGAIHGDYIYMIERGGYLIATDLDLVSVNVYKLPGKIENFLFSSEDTLYYENDYFKLNKKR